MYDKILVPTDGSEGAESALNHAEELASQYNAEVHVLYVADVRANVSETTTAMMKEGLEELGEETVNDADDKLDDRIDVSTAVKPGIPHVEIGNYVEDEEIDLVVMGTHGRSGLDRLLIGSVTEKVIRTVSVPVMTVPVEE